MRIKEITIGKKFNIGNYESLEIRATAEVEIDGYSIEVNTDQMMQEACEELNHKIEKAYNSHPFEGGKHRFIVLQSGKRKGLLKIKANSNEANMLVMKIENLDSFQWTTIDPNLKSYKTPRYRYQYDKKNVALYVIPKEDELK